jgi:hypothetical protein
MSGVMVTVGFVVGSDSEAPDGFRFRSTGVLTSTHWYWL